MIHMKGKYSEGIVFSDEREEKGIAQIQDLLDQPFSENANPRFMPDYHAGLGSVIGTTLLVTDEICPNLVGVDIGCGIRTERFATDAPICYADLDRYIRAKIPAGFRVHDRGRDMDFIERLHMKRKLKDPARLRKSIGTLGGGNHYIEIGRLDQKGHYALTVHSGSRNLGLQVAEYYQKVAEARFKGQPGRPPKGLETLKQGEFGYDEYLHDMQIAREFAAENRRVMAEVILNYLAASRTGGYDTVHNYIEVREDGPHILRKGAISAYTDELVTIPLNMRDGILIARGLGNPEWNWSAPHGAGRIMSRTQARKDISMREYEDAMEGIFTTSVHARTLDEAPHAYKPMEEIIRHIGDTVEILHHVKPVYNFKA